MKISNEYAERQVIGLTLRSHNAFLLCCEHLTAEHFSNPVCRNCFMGLSQLHSQNLSATSKVLFDCCRTLKCDVPIEEIVTMVYEASTFDDASYWIEEVRKHYLNKYYLTTLHDAIKGSEKAESYETEVPKVVDRLDNIDALGTESTIQIVADVLKMPYKTTSRPIEEHIKNKIENRANNIVELSGISTGFKNLDEQTDGLQDSWLYIFGARPSEGKTQFLLNLMHNIASQDIPILFFSLEMPAADVMTELLAIDGKFDHKRMMNGECNPFEYQAFLAASDAVAKFPLYIDDQPSLSINQLKLRAKRMIKSSGIRAIFIDYAQELTGPGASSNKQEEMQAVSRGLRELAKEMKVPVVCAAQVNRQSEATGKAVAPSASHLRESGQLEQCAWFIGMLHRPDRHDPYDRPGVLEVHIRKNRFGQLKKLKFDYDPDHPKYSYRITEIDELVSKSDQRREVPGKTFE